jgi:molybdopterin-guanine dinucleotide biosynthesis protein A
MTAQKLSAVLLAGGRSTRMGRDKALLEVDGQPMWRRQRNVLAALGPKEIFLSVRAEQAWARGIAGFDGLLFDGLEAGGPLIGITAGLERMTAPWLAVLAIDLPAMTTAWFEELARHCTPGVGCVGRQEKFYEPLAAIYPREMMSLAWEALARGEFTLQTWIDRGVAENRLRVRDIAASEKTWFENRNSPR